MNTTCRIEYEFFGSNLELTIPDRHDVNVMRCIVDIETWEEEKDRGLEYIARMEKAGIMIGDEKVHKKMIEILQERHKNGHEKG